MFCFKEGFKRNASFTCWYVWDNKLDPLQLQTLVSIRKQDNSLKKTLDASCKTIRSKILILISFLRFINILGVAELWQQDIAITNRWFFVFRVTINHKTGGKYQSNLDESDEHFLKPRRDTFHLDVLQVFTFL